MAFIGIDHANNNQYMYSLNYFYLFIKEIIKHFQDYSQKILIGYFIPIFNIK